MSLVTLYSILLSFYYYLKIQIKKNSLEEGINLCNKCKNFHTDKTTFCLFCNECYYKRDHHCALLGKCINNNNYKDFFGLLFFLSSSLLFMSYLFSNILLFLVGLSVLFYICFISYVWSHNLTIVEFLHGERNIPKFNVLYKVLFDESKEDIYILFLPFMRMNISLLKEIEQ